MNEIEVQRIAAAANQLRPDWPVSSLVSLLNRPGLINRHRRDVAVALAWVACDSATKTPARVLEAGPWWQAIGDADGGAPRIDWLDRCAQCNYTKAACERVYGPDDHPFVSNRDARERARAHAVPMPEEIRELVVSPPLAIDRRPYVPETQTETEESA